MLLIICFVDGLLLQNVNVIVLEIFVELVLFSMVLRLMVCLLLLFRRVSVFIVRLVMCVFLEILLVMFFMYFLQLFIVRMKLCLLLEGCGKIIVFSRFLFVLDLMLIVFSILILVWWVCLEVVIVWDWLDCLFVEILIICNGVVGFVLVIRFEV